jgi:hypothetical protein
MAKKTPIQNQNYQATVDKYFRTLSDLKPSGRPTASAPRTSAGVPAKKARRIDINQEIAREQKLRNDNAEQDIRLKRQTLERLFRFLTIETVLIFLFAIAQATQWPGDFHPDETSFQIVVGATIAQITGMLFVAVRYLFPKK